MAGFSVALSGGSAAAPIALAVGGVPVTQDFDSLASSGSSSALPAGWAMNLASYTAGSGTNAGQGIRSYGSAGNAERAFGSLGTLHRIGAEFQNATGTSITDLEIDYTGEQWRRGNNAAVDRLFFEYSLDATSLTDGAATWVSVSALDFASPVVGAGSGAALNGNLAANRSALSATITGLNIANGAVFWVRWRDEAPASGSQNHGLAVDDFSLTPTIVPEPHTTTLLALGLLALAARRER